MRLKSAIPQRALVSAMLALALVSAAILVHEGIADGTAGTNVTQSVVRVFETALPPLPKVVRPVPQQPVIGLAVDIHLDKSPPRATRGLDLVKAGWTYNCMECHKLFPARWHYDDRPFNEHKDLALDHGNNRFCLNCHHPTNRNAFVDYDGSEIAQADVVNLCAKCHGTIHRDWEAGVHGRQNGFWQAGAGEKTRLRCIQCHDPHSPKFKAMKPLAPLKYPARAAHPPAELRAETEAQH